MVPFFSETAVSIILAIAGGLTSLLCLWEFSYNAKVRDFDETRAFFLTRQGYILSHTQLAISRTMASTDFGTGRHYRRLLRGYEET